MLTNVLTFHFISLVLFSDSARAEPFSVLPVMKCEKEEEMGSKEQK